MHEPLFTRCPECRTTFRARPEQLAARGGRVRCGVCRAVFDAEAHAIDIPRRVAEATVVALDERAAGPETVTLGAVLVPAPSPAATEVAEAAGGPAAPADALAAAPDAIEAAAVAGLTTPAAGPAAAPAAAADAAGNVASAALATPAPISRGMHAAAWAFAALLVLLLGAQAVGYYRHGLAAYLPSSRPWLEEACRGLGCTIDPVRELARVSIEGSDLQADAAHQGLLLLTALLRNQASFAVALPHIELTLTDAQDRTLVRKILAPADYTPATPSETGVPAGAEISVKLFFDGSGLSPGGYRLELLYP